MALGAIGVVAIVPLVAIAIVWSVAAGRPPIDLWSVAGLALVCAVVIGPAVVHWAIERRRANVGQMMLVGGLVGVLPPIFALVSAAIGFAVQGGVDYALFVFKHGASVPWYGSLRWLAFGELLLECAAIGAISAAIVTPLVRKRQVSPA
jgi:hypothetical protein